MSNYIIQSGDVFTVSYLAGVWGWQGSGDGEVSGRPPCSMRSRQCNRKLRTGLFWVGLADGVGLLTPSESQQRLNRSKDTLGILFQNTTGDKIAQIDEISVTVIPSRQRWLCWAWVLWLFSKTQIKCDLSVFRGQLMPETEMAETS